MRCVQLRESVQITCSCKVFSCFWEEVKEGRKKEEKVSLLKGKERKLLCFLGRLFKSGRIYPF